MLFCSLTLAVIFVIRFCFCVNNVCQQTGVCNLKYNESVCLYLHAPHIPEITDEKCNFIHEGKLLMWNFETAMIDDGNITRYFNHSALANAYFKHCAKLTEKNNFKLLSPWFISNVDEKIVGNNTKYKIKLTFEESTKNVEYVKENGTKLRCKSKWTIIYTAEDFERLLTTWKKGESPKLAMQVEFNRNYSVQRGVEYLDPEELSVHYHRGAKTYLICQSETVDKYCREFDNKSGLCKACHLGYKGNYCEMYNKCENWVCYNGGEAKQIGDLCTCQCPQGYWGNRCHGVKGKCISSPCGPNGYCVSLNTNYMCVCNADYHGKHCESKKSTFTLNKEWIIMIAVILVLLLLAALYIMNVKKQRTGRQEFLRLDNFAQNQKSTNLQMGLLNDEENKSY